MKPSVKPAAQHRVEWLPRMPWNECPRSRGIPAHLPCNAHPEGTKCFVKGCVRWEQPRVRRPTMDRWQRSRSRRISAHSSSASQKGTELDEPGVKLGAAIVPAVSVDHVGMLLLRIASRDAAAFRNLYYTTSSTLFGVVFGLLRNRAEAEDALQDVYLKVWLRSFQYDPAKGHGIAWLVRISQNQAFSRLRARRVSHTGDQTVLDALPDQGKCAEAKLIISDGARWVAAALQSLTPEMALAVQDAYLSGLTYAELADRHDVPINTMRTRLRRGLLKLRQMHDVGSM